MKRHGVPRDDVSRFAELNRGLVFAFGGHDFGAALAFGLGFLRHRALHIVGQYDVFNFDRRYLGAPWLRVEVDDILDLLVDARGVREKLIEAESTNDVAHGGLADLIDRIIDVLDRDYGFFRIGNMIYATAAISIETLSFVMIFCDGICIVTVRKDTRVICSMGRKMSVSPGPRAPSNFPRRKTTPRSYCLRTRSEPRMYRAITTPE